MLIAYENEAIGARKAGSKLDYVVPAQTILIDTPVAVVSAARIKGPAAFVRFLTTPAAKKIFGQHGDRPVLKPVLAKFPVSQAGPALHDREAEGGPRSSVRFFDKTDGKVTNTLGRVAGQPPGRGGPPSLSSPPCRWCGGPSPESRSARRSGNANAAFQGGRPAPTRLSEPNGHLTLALVVKWPQGHRRTAQSDANRMARVGAGAAGAGRRAGRPAGGWVMLRSDRGRRRHRPCGAAALPRRPPVPVVRAGWSGKPIPASWSGNANAAFQGGRPGFTWFSEPEWPFDPRIGGQMASCSSTHVDLARIEWLGSARARPGRAGGRAGGPAVGGRCAADRGRRRHRAVAGGAAAQEGAARGPRSEDKMPLGQVRPPAADPEREPAGRQLEEGVSTRRQPAASACPSILSSRAAARKASTSSREATSTGLFSAAAARAQTRTWPSATSGSRRARTSGGGGGGGVAAPPPPPSGSPPGRRPARPGEGAPAIRAPPGMPARLVGRRRASSRSARSGTTLASGRSRRAASRSGQAASERRTARSVGARAARGPSCVPPGLVRGLAPLATWVRSGARARRRPTPSRPRRWTRACSSSASCREPADVVGRVGQLLLPQRPARPVPVALCLREPDAAAPAPPGCPGSGPTPGPRKPARSWVSTDCCGAGCRARTRAGSGPPTARGTRHGRAATTATGGSRAPSDRVEQLDPAVDRRR